MCFTLVSLFILVAILSISELVFKFKPQVQFFFVVCCVVLFLCVFIYVTRCTYFALVLYFAFAVLS
jgi:hypothetical protein